MSLNIIGPIGSFTRRSTLAGIAITCLLGSVLVAAQDAAAAEQPQRVVVPHHVDLGPPASAKAAPVPPSARFGLDFAGELLPYVLDPVDTVALVAEDAARAEPPLRMGILRDVGFAATDGPAVIQPVPGGGSVWSVAFISPQAKGLRLHFTHFDLPPGAELWLCTPDALGQAEGPYTATGPRRSGEFWSSIVWGEEVRLEYFLPGNTGTPGFFFIENLAHLYRGLELPVPTGGGDMREGPCHNDVMCYPAWQPLHNATARLSVILDDGAYLCSGTLLNTEAADETPYVLTANHCVPNAAAAEDIVAYWFYQTESCDGPPASHVRSDGGEYLWGSVYHQYDQTLVMVKGTIPDGLTWSGWDTSVSLPNGTDVACISHPDGARKKITFGYLITHPFGNPADFWGVSWTSGTIEPGSSGSGLYPDDTQLLIGVASHSADPTDCNNPDGPSGYGKFGRFYTFGTVDELLEEGTDDPLEDFDSCGAALPIGTFPVSLPGLIVKSTDEDWYRVNIPTGSEFTADATFVHINGDIDLELYDACGGVVVASAYSNTDDEHLSYYNGSAAANFYLRIFLDADTRQEYDLTLDLNEVACPGDLDGDGDTDQADLGILLADWGCTGGGCAGDLDGDGDTDQADLGILLADWGCGTEP